MTREEKFGRIIALANVLGKQISLGGGQTLEIAAKHLTDMGRQPASTLVRIHKDLLDHASQFDESDQIVMDMMGEMIAELDFEEMSDDPLSAGYLNHYYRQQHTITDEGGVMGTAEAAELWGLSQDHVKRLCRDGKIQARKIGMGWAVIKNQPNPKQTKSKEELQ